jgi:hypothetical protein
MSRSEIDDYPASGTISARSGRPGEMRESPNPVA